MKSVYDNKASTMNTLIFFICCITIISAQDPQDGMKFFLLSPSVPKTEVFLGQLSSAPFDTTKPIKMFSHGYLDDSNVAWYEQMKNSYFQTGNVQVVYVDWGAHSTRLYNEVVAKAPDLGRVLSQIILELVNDVGISVKNIHLIGFSMGGQISGFAGQDVLAGLNEKVARITGLDPAGPLYDEVSTSERLSQDDADFVDVIHTDADKLGFRNPTGHADFYPNGGLDQKGCPELGSCSHMLAIDYFIESITSNQLIGTICDTYDQFLSGACASNPRAVLGENIPIGTSGVFYLETNELPPYGRG